MNIISNIYIFASARFLFIMNDNSNSEIVPSDSESMISKKSISLIWNYFSKSETFKFDFEAKCKSCNSKYRCSSGSTSTLWTHLQSSHRGLYNEAKRIPVEYTSVLDQLNGIKQKVPFDNEKFLEQVCKFIIKKDLPFRIVESPHCIELLQYLEPKVNLLKKDGIRVKIFSMFEDYKINELGNIMCADGKISFTSDIWTTDSAEPFMSVTAHFVRNWKLQHRLVDFVHIPGNHTGPNISRVFRETLTNLAIPNDKLMAITLDNASNNNTFVSDLITHSFDLYHVRCMGHICNLVCSAAVEPLEKEIKDLRLVVTKIRNSSLKRRALFTKCSEYELENLMVVLDVITRWNSMYLMIHRCLKLKSAIKSLLIDDDDFSDISISQNDWLKFSEMVNFLKKLYQVTNELSADTTVSISKMIPLMNYLFCHFKEKSDSVFSFIQKGCSNALIKLSQYYEKTQDFYFVAIILDPRLNLDYFLSTNFSIDSKITIDKIKTIMNHYFNIYSECLNCIKSAPQEKDEDFNGKHL